MLAERQQTALSFPETLNEVEKIMLDMPQVACGVIHRFSPGVYMREVSIPAGTFAVGHYQNREHLNMLLKGRVAVIKPEGGVEELVAPLMFVGKPGRKIGLILEDMVWLNIYPTNETDVEKLEAELLTKSDSWLSSNEDKARFASGKYELDRLDYKALLAEYGYSEEEAKAQAYNTEDMTELPHGGYKIKIGNSAIEGKGLFATYDIAEGEIIAPARIFGKRTIAGRYANHSVTPNARMHVGSGCEIELVAIAPIAGCKGGEDGEEITVNYRECIELARRLK